MADDELTSRDDPRSDTDERWALVLLHREHMLNVARRRCRTEEDAEDCVHEAMLRVAQFETLDPDRVGAMLTSVTVRLAVDIHRGRARARRYLPRLVSVPAQQQLPDEAVVDAGEARWLAAQLEHLPDREREVLRQRAAGYTIGESAARLSVSYKSVESAFNRARGRMRMWAGAGSLLVAEYLRRLRLRQQPGAVLASLAMLSAGCLVLSSLPSLAPTPGHASDVTAATAPPAWSDGVPATAHVQRATARQPIAAAVPAGRYRAGAARSAAPPALTQRPVAQAQIPTGHGTASANVTQAKSGNYFDVVIACLEQQPYFQNNTVGCPPQ